MKKKLTMRLFHRRGRFRHKLQLDALGVTDSIAVQKL